MQCSGRERCCTCPPLSPGLSTRTGSACRAQPGTRWAAPCPDGVMISDRTVVATYHRTNLPRQAGTEAALHWSAHYTLNPISPLYQAPLLDSAWMGWSVRYPELVQVALLCLVVAGDDRKQLQCSEQPPVSTSRTRSLPSMTV